MEELLSHCPRWVLPGRGRPALCAVSGGLDSMCLLDLLDRWCRERDGRVVAAHFNHRLRGAEADRDETFVRDWCAAHDIAFVSSSGDVRGLMEREGLSLEEAARKLRYGALEKVRQETGAAAIFLAHHQDDQAETVLLNLVRGAGTRGMRGMLPVSGYLARPFLEITRRDTEAYCEEMGLAWCEDSSNEDQSMKRNWVRKTLLPLLETQNPQIRKQLAQAAALAASDEAYLEKLAGRYISAYGREVFDTWDIKVEKDFAALPLALQSRVIRILVRRVGGAEMSYDHVRKILEMIERGVGNKSLDVPGGVRLIYLNGRLMVGKNQRSREEERAAKLAQKERQRNERKS